VPLIISIPILTFDIDYTIIDNMGYNTKMSDNKIENKINLNHKIDIKKINISTYRYTSKYKKAILKTYMQDIGYRKSYSKQQRTCQVTNAIVELVDIFPTIADLAGIPIPICQINNTDYQLYSKNILIYQEESINPCSEGITLLPLIKNTLKCQVR